MLCAYMRTRYQVSVYRTIGPLVSYGIVKFSRNEALLLLYVKLICYGY